MAYIRDNIDYYMSLGYSEEKAKEKEITKRIDYGFCNPIKIKLAEEEIKLLKKE